MVVMGGINLLLFYLTYNNGRFNMSKAHHYLLQKKKKDEKVKTERVIAMSQLKEA